MTDSTLLLSRHLRQAPGLPAARRFSPATVDDARPVEDRLWCEHGWGLGRTAVATLVGLILLASAATHLLG